MKRKKEAHKENKKDKNIEKKKKDKAKKKKEKKDKKKKHKKDHEKKEKKQLAHKSERGGERVHNKKTEGGTPSIQSQSQQFRNAAESKVAISTIQPIQQTKQVAPPPRRRLGPLSDAEYEEQRNRLREEYDPSTGRMRLVRGDGEIVERIVSREQHRAINAIATNHPFLPTGP
jgi:hypothetical protein